LVQANSLRSIKIKEIFMNFIREKKFKGFVEYASDTIPKLAAKILEKQKKYKTLDQLTRIAISLGRMRLDPLTETLQLWQNKINENVCLQIPLHHL
jgi:hypothetical protein